MALRTPDDVFHDYAARRRGILRALTTEVETFFKQCDPNRENLCLYGCSDGTFEVSTPCEEVPPEMPEPSIGINFARDGMKREDWLSLVAVHSDSWLMAIAFYNAARLNAQGRRQLFNDINALPTCYEIVTGRVTVGPGGVPRPAPGGLGIKRRRSEGGPGSGGGEAEEVGEGGDEEAEEAEEASECPNCGRLYQEGEFWLSCDECGRWFDGRCVGLTEEAWDKRRDKSWACPLCLSNKAGMEVGGGSGTALSQPQQQQLQQQAAGETGA